MLKMWVLRSLSFCFVGRELTLPVQLEGSGAEGLGSEFVRCRICCGRSCSDHIRRPYPSGHCLTVMRVWRGCVVYSLYACGRCVCGVLVIGARSSNPQKGAPVWSSVSSSPAWLKDDGKTFACGIVSVCIDPRYGRANSLHYNVNISNGLDRIQAD